MGTRLKFGQLDNKAKVVLTVLWKRFGGITLCNFFVQLQRLRTANNFTVKINSPTCYMNAAAAGHVKIHGFKETYFHTHTDKHKKFKDLPNKLKNTLLSTFLLRQSKPSLFCCGFFAFPFQPGNPLLPLLGLLQLLWVLEQVLSIKTNLKIWNSKR